MKGGAEDTNVNSGLRCKRLVEDTDVQVKL